MSNRDRHSPQIRIISAIAAGRAPISRHADPVPRSPDELRSWVNCELGLLVPDRPVIAGHHSPLDYLAHVFFEGRYVRAAGGDWARAGEQAARAPDCVVWANRGGGKTYLGAVATLLDLLFKPGVQVRILGGSLEQSRRMHAYLLSLSERPNIARRLEAKITTRAVRASTGACAEVLAASQTSVRGTRVQKIRCDEVDLFAPELWEAAQLVTRSMAPARGPWGDHVRGSVEALSTMHVPGGLMWSLAAGAHGPADPARPVFRWGVVDALARCEEQRACAGCALWGECAGRAKGRSRAPGHIRIDDALAMKSRVDRATWESEMLCLRPRTRHAVYPEFEPSIHVLEGDDPRLRARRVAGWYAGMDFGIRAESVVLLAGLDESGTLVIEHEAIATDTPVVDQRDRLRQWIEAGLAPRDELSPNAGESHGGLCWVAIDPAGLGRSEQTGRSNASVLREAGWRVVGPRSEIETGLRMVRARLAPADPGRPPTLFIHRRCRRLIECMQAYRYPANKPESARPEKGEFDHACDALRYLVTSIDRHAADAKVERY